jgi:hypothetical protein
VCVVPLHGLPFNGPQPVCDVVFLSSFCLIFTGPLSSEAFAEGGTCEDAWIYVDRNGGDVPVKNTVLTSL